MFSSGSQLLCLQQKTRTGREQGGWRSPRPITGPAPGSSSEDKRDLGVPRPEQPVPRGPGRALTGGERGRRGWGCRSRGGGHAARGEGSPAHPGELGFQRGARGRRLLTAGAPGGRPGRWGWSGAPRGGGEGRAAAALICKQKERRDPNKSGRAGDIPALRTAPRTAPHRAAPLTWRTSLAT